MVGCAVGCARVPVGRVHRVRLKIRIRVHAWNGRPGRPRAIHPRKRLPGGEAKSGVNRDGKDDGAENTHRGILRVYRNRSKRSGGHCDDGNDDGSLSYWFHFNFKDQYHAAAVD